MFSEVTLEHYGIKGMRWGIRRTPEQLGHKISKLKRKSLNLEKKIVKAEEKKDKADRKVLKYYNRGLIKAATNDMKGANKLYKNAKTWNKRSEEYQKYILKTRERISKNAMLARFYQQTIDAIDSGLISEGNGFIDRFIMRYPDDEED